MEFVVSDQTALSFASKTAPADGVVVVFAEEGPKLTPTAQDLDKKSKGLLSRAAEITGFKGKKEQTVDLLAPQGLKFARLVLVGLDKASAYSPEDWLNLGGAVRGMLSGKEAPAAHIFLETAGGDCGARRYCELRPWGAAPRLQVQKVQDQDAQEKRCRRRSQRQDAEEDRHSLRRS